MSSTPEQTSTAIPFSAALRFWFKLGCISFGGPAGQIALLHQELVERRRWISEARFLHALNYCMLLPGPEAQQLATYLGWLMHRTWGGIVAGGLFVLPSLLLLILLSALYAAYGQTMWVAGLFYGIKPAVAAIVAQAAWRIGSRTLKNPWLWSLAATAFLSLFAFNLPFPVIVLGAGLLGWLGGRYFPQVFRLGAGHAVHQQSAAPALIDDHTPAPAHAQVSLRRMLGLALAGATLWCLPMALCWSVGGWDHPLTQMGWFFTKAALLTFGGAYAVLPYVYQGAVSHYGWLSPQQMMDGLALGETTPGPLIMVVVFVGFIGGYGKAVFGPEHLFLAGTAAACLVTWFTFLPSFLFILLGGPWVERSHGDLKFTAPLTAITAAVVGVILNLALFFAWQILRPQGESGGWDGAALVLSLAAALALFRFKIGVIPVILAGAVFGLVWRTVM